MTIKRGDLVTDGIRPTQYRVVKVIDVFGIPSADLIHVRKNGTTGIVRGRSYKNLPVSCLSLVETAEQSGKTMAEIFA